MAEFLRVLLDVIEFLWPLRIVWEWEGGGYYVCGRYWRKVGPGCWPVVPFFCDIKTVDMVPDIYSTGLQDITTKGGDVLTFEASVTFIVTDAAEALNAVVRHEETTVESAGAVLADTLADVEEERLDPTRRKGLIRTCMTRINEELTLYGTEVTALRFTTFVRKQRTYRLLMNDTGAPAD
jgi:regulator of protease activity HflC (stomatin/prohibitin superfamily)